MRKIRVNRHFAEYVRPVTQRNQVQMASLHTAVTFSRIKQGEYIGSYVYVYIFNLLVFLPVSFNSFEYFVSVLRST